MLSIHIKSLVKNDLQFTKTGYHFFILCLAIITLISCTTDPIESQLNTQESSSNSKIEPERKCGTFDRVRKPNFHINNNIWSRNSNSNGTGNQCIWVHNINSWGVNAYHSFGDGQIKSYPSIIVGKHYGDGPSEVKDLPIKIKNMKKLLTSWTTLSNYTRGNTSYDVWFDANKNKQGENDFELMLWLDTKELEPLAHAYDSNGAVPRYHNVRIGAYDYDIYEKYNSAKTLRVMTFICKTNRKIVYDMNIKSFIDFCINQGWMNKELYLTSVQAGWEIIEGGSDCKTRAFDLSLTPVSELNSK